MPRFGINPRMRLLLDTLSIDPYWRLLVIWIISVLLYFFVRFIQPKIVSHSRSRRKKGKKSVSTFQKFRAESSGKETQLNHHKNCQDESRKVLNHVSVRHPEASRYKPTVYGLRPHEVAAGCTSESDDDESGLTQIELRKLQQTDAFDQWRIKKNMRTKDVKEEIEKVFVYKKLRKLHPESFWRLCRPDTLVSVDTVEPGKMVLFCEYMVSRCIDIAVFVLTFKYCLAYNGEKVTPLQIAVCTSVLYWFCARHWITARPSSGALFSAYYNTLGAADTACKSGPAEVALTNMMEDVFVIGTLGLGLILSLHSRCFTTHAQSIAEKIFGIQLKIETKTSLSG